jgi:hypothetical protein
VKVRTPEVVEAFSPSLTVAYYWGSSLPAFIGVMAGYSPTFQFDEEANSKRGAFNIGFTAGVYVPFIDFN